MTNRERAMSVLHYREYDRLPIVHFGFWEETIEKWKNEGHISTQEAENVYDGSKNESIIAEKLGFDFNWYNCVCGNAGLLPPFERKLIETKPDGTRLVQNELGVIELEKDNAGSIPAEVDHLLKDRATWEKYYLPRLKYSPERIDIKEFSKLADDTNRDKPLGLHLGSMFGSIRNLLGVENVSYLYLDDEELYDEIIDTMGDLNYNMAKTILETGAKFDFAHYWEDICFKNGPLVIPKVFNEKVGKHYKKINDLVKSYGIDIISLDCDGLIDSLIPTWFENGVNTMFPMEVGTWNANIAPWREKYGKNLRGVGGMNKTVFASDYKAIDAEIQRLKPLIALGGYIPCPDHRIAPDAIWENVQYYCEQMRKIFS